MKQSIVLTLLALALLGLLAACVSPVPTAIPESLPEQAPAAEPVEAPAEAPAFEQVAEPLAAPRVESVAATGPVTKEDIVNIEWQWSDLTAKELSSQSATPYPENYTITFFPDNTVSIKADCNMVQGTYIARGNTLLIEMGPSTMAFCGEDSLDQQFLALLSQVNQVGMQDDSLQLILVDSAGVMGFSQIDLSVGLDPSDILLDTHGLPYSWQANVVPATPYDQSQPPGPMGLPEHIQINFGVTDPADKQFGDPIMYIIPVDNYIKLWADADNMSVAQVMRQIYKSVIVLTSPAPTFGFPVLPFEEVTGVNDLAVQVGRPTASESSASKNGYRFVGRWAQSPNPVTNQGLRYAYQGFTNDGEYLVSFFYPVTTAALPDTAGEIPQEEMDQVSGDIEGYLENSAAALNELAASDWEPDLETLDALVASLEIDGMTENGLTGNEWQAIGTNSEPGGEYEEIANPEGLTVSYFDDGRIAYQADCNKGSGTYEVTGGISGSLRTQLGPATLAECGPESNGAILTNTLAAAQDYRVHPGGHSMELVRPAAGGSLFFEKLGPVETPPLPPVEIPTPPSTIPTAEVTAAGGVNVRTGPGTEYQVLGVAPAGSTGEVIGRSADGEWWAVLMPSSPTSIGWVSASHVEVKNGENVPILAAPPTPVPAATSTPVPPTATPTPAPLPSATPSPEISFWADSYEIAQGDCTTLRWRVSNVQAVWVYPQGANYQDHPVTGEGSQQVCPNTPTTYEMRVQLQNGSVEFRHVTVNVTASNPLANTSWDLSSMFVNQVLIPGTTINLSFAENSLSGNSGCNQYSGSYSVSGNRISVGPLVSTQMACGHDTMEQERIYLEALQSANTYELNGGQLIIRAATGQEILRFNALVATPY
ncbi:MAG: META domain-containing protein [Chloroflexota bacterium]|nr:META domain-containing protein [Chloroflexota bacterium]